MKEQIINILIIDDNVTDVEQLYSILRSPGNNIFKAYSKEEAFNLLNQKEFSLILCSADIKNTNLYDLIDELTTNYIDDNTFIIATAKDGESVYNLVKGMQKGIVDYLIKPYRTNLVKAKINLYKRLYFKNNRISNLLENILPQKTINEFKKTGKSTPQKYNNCTVLFTDFVNFSGKASVISPKELIEKLDYYFTKFDEIIQKYHLEKIKTIGDAYMAVGGVSENTENIELKTALAALEIRNFMANEIITKKALGLDFWDIRIGIHSGELIAGVIGKHKFSFDVWGDTVNIAARCEQNSKPNQINISADFQKHIKTYFNFTERGKIEVKNRGEIEMYFLDSIINSYSLYNKGKKANNDLRTLAGLSIADFNGLRHFIISKLKAELSDDLYYHSIEHTLNVENSVIKYANLEGLNADSIIKLRTAALFHDSGFLISYQDNEEIGVKILEKYAPGFGYKTDDIKTISKIILSTNNKIEPITISEKIMCDADHDYLGRKDYQHVADKLYTEIQIYNTPLNKNDWIEMQIQYLETKHKYYTTSAFNLRQQGKNKRILELKNLLNKF